jgi:hypothetical protein
VTYFLFFLGALTVAPSTGQPLVPTSPAAAGYRTLYDRLDEANRRHTSTPSLTGLSPEMASLRSTVGSWRGDYHVFATPRRPEHHHLGLVRIELSPDQQWLFIDGDYGTWHDRFFLGFDRLSKVWRLTEVEHPEVDGGAILPSTDRWEDGRLTFDAMPAKLDGVNFVGRVSLIRANADTLRILWEERVSPGLWVTVDEQLLTRAP